MTNFKHSKTGEYGATWNYCGTVQLYHGTDDETGMTLNAMTYWAQGIDQDLAKRIKLRVIPFSVDNDKDSL